jgi:hypothetical protein
MPTTPGGLRYPAAADPPDVPADMQRLAEDVEADTPAGIASSFVQWPSTAAGVTTSVSATFPAGRFSIAPRVVVTAIGALPSGRAVSIASPTTSSVLLYCTNTGGTTVSPSGHWVAVQDRGQTSLGREEPGPQAGDTFGWVVCPTAGCGNQGIPLEVQTGYTDDDGVDQAVDAFACGVCGTALTPSDTPPATS